jgi:hypothetical protein
VILPLAPVVEILPLLMLPVIVKLFDKALNTNPPVVTLAN